MEAHLKFYLISTLDKRNHWRVVEQRFAHIGNIISSQPIVAWSFETTQPAKAFSKRFYYEDLGGG